MRIQNCLSNVSLGPASVIEVPGLEKGVLSDSEDALDATEAGGRGE